MGGNAPPPFRGLARNAALGKILTTSVHLSIIAIGLQSNFNPKGVVVDDGLYGDFNLN
jgi:hypothetical protein